LVFLKGIILDERLSLDGPLIVLFFHSMSQFGDLSIFIFQYALQFPDTLHALAFISFIIFQLQLRVFLLQLGVIVLERFIMLISLPELLQGHLELFALGQLSETERLRERETVVLVV